MMYSSENTPCCSQIFCSPYGAHIKTDGEVVWGPRPEMSIHHLVFSFLGGHNTILICLRKINSFCAWQVCRQFLLIENGFMWVMHISQNKIVLMHDLMKTTYIWKLICQDSQEHLVTKTPVKLSDHVNYSFFFIQSVTILVKVLYQEPATYEHHIIFTLYASSPLFCNCLVQQICKSTCMLTLF